MNNVEFIREGKRRRACPVAPVCRVALPRPCVTRVWSSARLLVWSVPWSSARLLVWPVPWAALTRHLPLRPYPRCEQMHSFTAPASRR